MSDDTVAKEEKKIAFAHFSHRAFFLFRKCYLQVDELLGVLGYNATFTARVISYAHVFPGFLTPVLTLLSFQSHQLLFSHALAVVKICRKESLPQPGLELTTTRS